MRTLMDYRDYYDLEGYLFGTVTQRFAHQGLLGAFDLFCIVIWKAERSKVYAARRLIKRSGTDDLEQAARQLTEGIARQPNARERLRYLCSPDPWGFRLATGSAILTVLYPDEFTVYDARVCKQLTECADFLKLQNKTNFDKLWEGYQKFIRAVKLETPNGLPLRDAVKLETPNGLPLRDKDRYLWGKSFHDQLKCDIARKYQTSSR